MCPSSLLVEVQASVPTAPRPWAKVEKRPAVSTVSPERVGTLRAVTTVSRSHFERLVAEAIRSVPAVIAPSLARLAVVVENAPPEADPDMYGRVEVHPLTGTTTDSDPGGRIVIFMRPLIEDCTDAPARGNEFK